MIHIRKPHFDVSPTEFVLPLLENLLHLEVIVVVSVRLVRMLQPFVISTLGDIRQLTENTDTIIQLFNNLEFSIRPEFDSALLARSLAKKSFSAPRYLT